MFSKMARSMLRSIRVTSKQELIDRIHHYFEEVNADPAIFRWKYKMDETIIWNRYLQNDHLVARPRQGAQQDLR